MGRYGGMALSLLVAIAVVACSTAPQQTPTPVASLPAGAVPLPTYAPTVNGQTQACGGVGFEMNVVVHGSPSDPAVAWVVFPDGTRENLLWPPGYYALFAPELRAVAPDGTVVAREGERATGGCPMAPDGLRIDVPTAPRLPPPSAAASSSGGPAPTTSTAIESATIAWWPTSVTWCSTPAWYRVHERVRSVGSCAGLLVDPAQSLRLKVGDEIDVHMATAAGQPLDPLPDSSKTSILVREPTADAATATYRAVAPGRATLVTARAFCLHAGDRQTVGPCPLLAVAVSGR